MMGELLKLGKPRCFRSSDGVEVTEKEPCKNCTYFDSPEVCRSCSNSYEDLFVDAKDDT